MNQDFDFNHLFRSESGKMVSVLSKLFGFYKIDMIEEVVQETFLSAFQTWKLSGYPNNPSAWLYRVAKNKILNEINKENKKESTIEKNASFFPISYTLEGKWEEEIQIFSDNQIRLLIMICNPSLPEDAMIALALKIVSGFTVEEIAKVFLSSRDTIQKKISRAKQKLIDEKIDLNLDNTKQYIERIPYVLKVLYLIFSEGYYSFSDDRILRKDLCLESLRLSLILIENDKTRTAECHALISLMCFHISRFESRVSDDGSIFSFYEQDSDKWNKELVYQGFYHLEIARNAKHKSDYLLEALIASMHTRSDTDEKWKVLSVLYTDLFQVTKNPIVAMNLAYVKGKLSKDPNERMEIINELLQFSELNKNHLFHLILAKLYSSFSPENSEKHFQLCTQICENPIERDLIFSNFKKNKN